MKRLTTCLNLVRVITVGVVVAAIGVRHPAAQSLSTENDEPRLTVAKIAIDNWFSFTFTPTNTSEICPDTGSDIGPRTGSAKDFSADIKFGAPMTVTLLDWMATIRWGVDFFLDPKSARDQRVLYTYDLRSLDARAIDALLHAFHSDPSAAKFGFAVPAQQYAATDDSTRGALILTPVKVNAGFGDMLRALAKSARYDPACGQEIMELIGKITLFHAANETRVNQGAAMKELQDTLHMQLNSNVVEPFLLATNANISPAAVPRGRTLAVASEWPSEP